jgi:pectate lyase
MPQPARPASRGTLSSPARRRLIAGLGSAGAAAALVIAGVALATPANAATLFSDNFENGLASTWSKSGGTWAVVSDGSHVLQQSDASSDLAREFNGSTSWTDYSLQATVKPQTFGSGDFVGIAARASGATKFYRLALLGSGGAQLQAVNGSSVAVLGSSSMTAVSGTTYTLRIDVTGTTVTGFINGTQFASGTSTLVAAGRIGLQTFQATAEFDNVTVTDAAGTPPPTTTTTTTTKPPTPTPTPTSTGTPPANTGLEGYAAISGNGHGATTGGNGGTTVTVTSLSQLTTEAGNSGAEIIRVNGLFSGSGDVKVASNKTIIGVGASSGLVGVGLVMKGVSNVIIRNMNISKVQASSGNGDAVHVESSDHIWIDHNDLSSDMNNGKDFYDGLVDLTHAADFITVSWNKLHDHFKVSLVGHSDSNGSEDTGHLRVTYHHNLFQNFNSRTPSLRFGTGHVYSNYFNTGDTGVHSRENAQMLVQNNVFRSVNTPIETTGDSSVDGFVNQSGNDFGGGTNNITQTGNFTNPPYSFTLTPTANVISVVTNGAGTGKI